MTLKRVVIRRAHVTETVEIQWVRADGSVYVERHTCPTAPLSPLLQQIEHAAKRGLVYAGFDASSRMYLWTKREPERKDLEAL